MTAAHFALKSSVPGFLRSAARVLMSWPPLSPARKYVARAYERLFDWRYGIETAGTIEVEDLHTDSLNLAFGSEYQAAPPGMFRRALAAIPIDFPSFTFVDFGCGKGRAVCMALDYQFRAVIGLEIGRASCRERV